MTFESIDPSKIEQLLTEKPKRGGGGRKPKVVERNLRTWYTLTHVYGSCENSECLSPHGRSSNMVSTVNGLDMCRYCFLAGFNHAEQT